MSLYPRAPEALINVANVGGRLVHGVIGPRTARGILDRDLRVGALLGGAPRLLDLRPYVRRNLIERPINPDLSGLWVLDFNALGTDLRRACFHYGARSRDPKPESSQDSLREARARHRIVTTRASIRALGKLSATL